MLVERGLSKKKYTQILEIPANLSAHVVRGGQMVLTVHSH